VPSEVNLIEVAELLFPHISLNLLDQTAQQLVAAIHNQTLWCFEGEMGAGKTTLIQSICKVMGVTDEITSPTFSLVNEYQTAEGKPLYHFDFYRIRSIEEVYDIGFEEYFDSGHICLIEWPSNIESVLAGEDIAWIRISKESEQERTIQVSFEQK
jgi:tRNA threonylcarbamoyladenosine biosynthesis protein TsaE